MVKVSSQNSHLSAISPGFVNNLLGRTLEIFAFARKINESFEGACDHWLINFCFHNGYLKTYSLKHARTRTHTHICIYTCFLLGYSKIYRLKHSCACAHTHAHTHTHTHTHVHTHTYTHTHTHIYIYIYILACCFTCMDVNICFAAKRYSTYVV